jgi:transcriptional regulator with XRE-family HTH domain
MSNLKRLRNEKNLSQGKLSEISGVNYQMIQKYEQGVKDINKAQGLTLQALANALDCKIEDLLEEAQL